MLCLYRYSFDLCGFEAAEAAALEASNRGGRTRCERQVTAVDNFLSQQEKKQKHHRRKRKCLQSRDHLHFLSELDEVRNTVTNPACEPLTTALMYKRALKSVCFSKCFLFPSSL